ncbi:hypothetical protein [Cryobacterium sp. Hh11]|nr:hypothetical protein [Cryobacterium sp. Hh11]
MVLLDGRVIVAHNAAFDVTAGLPRAARPLLLDRQLSTHEAEAL